MNQENSQIPVHVGLIMNGNRTWAKEKGLSVLEGYKKGSEALENTLSNCVEFGIKYVTAFSFSTENWRRPEEEKKILFSLFKKSLLEKSDAFNKIGVKIKFIGRTEDFSKDVQKLFKKVEQETENNSKVTLFAAVSYGGRAEIVDVTKRIVGEGLKPEEINEEKISERIYEAGAPDLDLVIRTNGKKSPRLSGFMLWQAAYSELYFTDTLWPEFDRMELGKAIEYYGKIKRNFGK